MVKRDMFDLKAHVYDKRGKVLAIGYNSYTKTHPKQKWYACKVGRPNAEYLHAEIAAIIKALKVGKPHSIFVERYTSTGPALAKPCNICMLAIIEAGIKEIRYTTKDGEERILLWD